MSKPVPRSRLNITYRTKIEGTPKKVKLPMRLLVLGDFTGASDETLDERDVHSILPGMELKSFMHELNVTAPIEPKALQQSLTGRLTGRITAKFKKQPDKGATTADLIISGTGVVSGSRNDNGLGDFEGPVKISGKLEGVALTKGVPTVTTATLMVTGKVRGDLEKGGVTGTVTGKYALAVAAGPAPTDLDLALDNEVSGDVSVALTIPLFELADAKPTAIAESVPETRRLVTLRRILLELRTYISGSPELRDAFKDLLENQTVQLVGLQQYLKTYYRQLLIESSRLPPIKAPELPAASKALLETLISASGTAGSWKSLQLLVSSSAPAMTAQEARAAVDPAKKKAADLRKAADDAAAAVKTKDAASKATPPTATADDVKAAQADADAKDRAAKDAEKAAADAEKFAVAAETAEAAKKAAEDAAAKAADAAAKRDAAATTPPTATADQVEAAKKAATDAAAAAKTAADAANAAAKAAPLAERGNLEFHDQPDDDFSETDRFVSAFSVFVANADLANVDTIRTVMFEIDRLSDLMDVRVQDQIQQVLHTPSFQLLERNWRSLQEICKQVTSSEVIVDFVDVDKDTLAKDLQDHSAYILNSALFRKVYVEEYDRYGGRPFGTMIGLYEFDSEEEDIEWLRTMSQISAAAHCPFIASVKPEFFGVKSWPELERKDDLETLLSMPQFGAWDEFRSSPSAAYIGLALPRFLLRKPYDAETGKSKFVNFVETVVDPNKDYLWGSAAVLFAKNLVRSFEASGWCQHIVGPVGGGLIQGLPVHEVLHHGYMEPQPPVEIAIPDYRELQFANTGFMTLIHRKGTADATFFSARSIKKAIEFEEELSTKNADLVCNLAYTFSITRIAHYVKAMVRDYIGSTADGPYIQKMLETWLIDYVTTTINPDDLTLLYYPFKAMSVEVKEKPGPLGWYNCVVSVLPHIQFQGMDVELRLEAALGGAK